ncbi:MAG: pyrroloquinoline quinone biosynthesis protein PqqB [Phycisphaerales bacterium]|nr:pyrroloquinoline quinone biosynthesis protein PqqB [Phycisphaerae bacterium]NNM25052.1 pyrroloquinoline quinone biosynthesis protein PqqB [Phycisphaerales bacterium]
MATLVALAPAPEAPASAPFVVVLGVTQDAGYPQAGCTAACCAGAWADPTRRRYAACLGIVDPVSNERWLIEATPDLRAQLRALDDVQTPAATPGLDGILLTHAHIGHYTGLVFIGHESIGATGVPVYAMPRMRAFLSENGPWDQLVEYENITLRPIEADRPFRLNDRIEVTAFRVPHREEYTEVVGFRIAGPERTILFIPDIDKWERWSRRLEDVIAGVDVAYVDGTFYADGELPNRDMSKIPHPFIAETMTRLAPLPAAERAKIRFIHLNHTNPALDAASAASRRIETAGFRVARQGERVDL